MCIRSKNSPIRKWFISSYVVAYVILITVFEFQISSPLVHFNVKKCIDIGEIGKIVKKEILASTSVLSYLGGGNESSIWIGYLHGVI